VTYPLVLSTLYLAGGLAILPLGLVILRENPRSPVNRATALMLFAGALGTMLGALGRLLEQPGAAPGTSVAWLRSFSYLWEFFFPSLLYFALVYPAATLRARPLHVLEAALFVPHLCHLVLVILVGQSALATRWMDAASARAPGGWAGGVSIGIIDLFGFAVTLLGRVHQQIFTLVNLSYAAVAIDLLRRSRSRARSARVRGQMRIILIGLTVCALAYAVAKLLPVVFPYRPSGRIEAVLTSLALLVASGTIGWAIMRHKFLDMRQLARRTILYGATAVLFALFYVVIMKQVSRLTAGIFGPNAQVIEIGFVVVCFIVFQPLLVGAEEALEAMLRRRGGYDPQVALQHLSRHLAAEVDLGAMRDRVAESLRTNLLVDGARLYTVERQRGVLVLDAGDRSAPIENESGLAAMLRYFEVTPEPALRHDLERSLPPLSDADRDTLSGWIQEHSLLVPIMQQDALCGILGVGPKFTGARFHAEDVGLLGLLGQQIASALDRLRLLSENLQKRLLEEEIQLASEIQKGLLPTCFPCGPGWATHAMSLASKEVGGDYYDAFVSGGALHLAIGDVSGKGVPAALLMSSLRAALRSNVQHLHSPAQVLEHINDLLYESTAPEKFATFFYGRLDTERHELVYANAGHNYPILVRAGGSVCDLADGGLVLGIIPGARYNDGRVALGPGDTLFLYTDGVTEASDGGDDEFGPERLQALLAAHSTRAAPDIVDTVLAEVRAFTRGADLGDDVTMLVVQRRTGDA
jgi:serine phosphatase RsbU (regulator of sigma subunit)